MDSGSIGFTVNWHAYFLGHLVAASVMSSNPDLLDRAHLEHPWIWLATTLWCDLFLAISSSVGNGMTARAKFSGLKCAVNHLNLRMWQGSCFYNRSNIADRNNVADPCLMLNCGTQLLAHWTCSYRLPYYCFRSNKSVFFCVTVTQ